LIFLYSFVYIVFTAFIFYLVGAGHLFAGVILSAIFYIGFAVLGWHYLAKPIIELLKHIKSYKAPQAPYQVFELEDLRQKIGSTLDGLEARQAQLSLINSELEQKISEELVKSRQKDFLLIQQSKLATMGEMINAIAHQWRQPLNSLGLTVQDLKFAYEAKELDANYLDTSIKEAMELIRHMSKTIDDFRNFYKPNKEKKPFSLNKAVQECLDLVKARLQAHFFKLYESYDNDLPEIMGYGNEFKQAVLNIVTNAQDAADEKGIKEPVLSVRSGKENGYAMLIIEDECGGIAQEAINRIFEPYFTTKEQGKGTGIGLYMTKTIIEDSMNGMIVVENTKKGARFIIKLPVI